MMINKIAIKANASEIKVLNDHLEMLTRSHPPYRHLRVLQSVLIPLYKKLVKNIPVVGTENMKKKISFSYYEAHYLEIFLRDISFEEINEYNKNVILKIRNELDAKLV